MMKKNVAFFCVALMLAITTLQIFGVNSNLLNQSSATKKFSEQTEALENSINDAFPAGSINSKILNSIKIAAGALTIVGAYKHNFFWGAPIFVAGTTCLASGVFGLNKDIHREPNSFLNTAKYKISKFLEKMFG